MQRSNGNIKADYSALGYASFFSVQFWFVPAYFVGKSGYFPFAVVLLGTALLFIAVIAIGAAKRCWWVPLVGFVYFGITLVQLVLSLRWGVVIPDAAASAFDLIWSSSILTLFLLGGIIYPIFLCGWYSREWMDRSIVSKLSESGDRSIESSL